MKLDILFYQVSDALKNATYKAFAVARHLGYQYQEENAINPQNEGNNKIIAHLKLSPRMQYANFSFSAPAVAATFRNVPVNPVVAEIVAPHPTYSAFDRLMQQTFRARYQGTPLIFTGLTAFEKCRSTN